MIFAGFSGFVLVLALFVTLNRISNTLMRIDKTQTLALAYLINPDAMLEGTNSDYIIENALTQASLEKGETKRAIRFFRSLKPLIDV